MAWGRHTGPERHEPGMLLVHRHDQGYGPCAMHRSACCSYVQLVGKHDAQGLRFGRVLGDTAGMRRHSSRIFHG